MKDFGKLFRSQLYSLTCEKKVLGLMLLLLTVIGYFMTVISAGELFFFDENAYGFEDISASMLLGMNAASYGGIAAMYVFIAVTVFFTRDLTDKTVNYEIMNGHDRKAVFLSRAAAAVFLAVVGGAVMFVVLPVITTIQYGWGSSITFGTIALRMTLVLILFVRVSAEIVLVSTLVKRTSFAIIAGVIAYLAGIVMNEFEGAVHIVTELSLTRLLSFSSFSLTHLDDTAELFFVDTMKASTAAAVALGNLIVAAVLIYISCRLFCRSDLE